MNAPARPATTTAATAAADGDAPLWRPTARQAIFLASRADEALYGGAAGGGKSAALIACPLRWIENPNYLGLYLRREATYLGDAVRKSQAIYPAFGGVLRQSPRIEWRFPSGATLWMGHCATPNDVANYDSFELSEVLFDELTHFEEDQYLGLRARLRGTDPSLPYWSRAATNPGGRGHQWVFERFGAWLDPTHASAAAPGERRWYLDGTEVAPGTPDALSRTFVPALLDDNPHVSAGYRAKLKGLPALRRAQLERGDWLVKPGGGDYFHRTRWRYLDAAPPRSEWKRAVRFWDLAASVNGDFTAGVLVVKTSDPAVPYVVADVVRFRGTPGDVRARILATAQADGTQVKVGLPEDPGQAGKDQQITYAALLEGFPIAWRRPDRDKEARASTVSPQVEAQRVALVRAAWNREFVDELHDFPGAKFDDQTDAFDDAMGHLLTTAAAAEPTPPPKLASPPSRRDMRVPRGAGW